MYRSGNSTESTADIHKVAQHESNKSSSQSCENTTVDGIRTAATPDKVVLPVDSCEYDTEKQQEWITKVQDALEPHKSSIVVAIDEQANVSLSDDFQATEDVKPKIDRQSEWMAAVQSSIQKYKEQSQ